MSIQLPKIVVILGPTASGKSALALELAHECSAEIINADSRQVYKRLRIGTAKPQGVWRAHTDTGEQSYHVDGVPHYIIDSIEADASFTMADWVCEARRRIYEILARGKRVCIVGGTGLYIDALVYNFQMPAGDGSRNIRTKLADKSLNELVGMLKEIDPLSASAIDIQNPRRVARALEFALTTHESFVISRTRSARLFDALFIGVRVPREELVKRINARVDCMIENGWVNEVRQLIREGIDSNCQALQSVGYCELIAYSEGRMTLPEAIERVKIATRRYAKRQMTWFKRNPSIHWIEINEEARALIGTFYNAEVTSS